MLLAKDSVYVIREYTARLWKLGKLVDGWESMSLVGIVMMFMHDWAIVYCRGSQGGHLTVLRVMPLRLYTLSNADPNELQLL